MARNCRPEDKAPTAQIREGQGKIFAEDLQVLELQQRNLLQWPGRNLLKLNIDTGGAVVSRGRGGKVIERLVALSARPAPARDRAVGMTTRRRAGAGANVWGIGRRVCGRGDSHDRRPAASDAQNRAAEGPGLRAQRCWRSRPVRTSIVHPPGGPGAPVLAVQRPKRTHCYLIAVLRDPASRGGSAAMHERLAWSATRRRSAHRRTTSRSRTTPGAPAPAASVSRRCCAWPSGWHSPARRSRDALLHARARARRSPGASPRPRSRRASTTMTMGVGAALLEILAAGDAGARAAPRLRPPGLHGHGARHCTRPRLARRRRCTTSTSAAPVASAGGGLRRFDVRFASSVG